MKVTRLDQLDTSPQASAAWDCMAHGNPFRRTAWLHSWWNHFQSCGELFVLQVSDRYGEIVGIAPWFIEHSVRQGRVVRSLGSGDTCSEYLGVLATREHEQQVTAALAQWLVAAAEGRQGAENRWDLLDLVSADTQDSVLSHFTGQLQDAGNHVHCRDAMSCWRINLPASWDEYLATLSRSQRKRVRRMDRKWLASGATRLQTVTTHAEFESAMDILIELHQQRHESLGNAGCFADEVFTRFLREAGQRLLQEQTLRLHWMELDGEPFAAEFQLANGDATYAYLGGMRCGMDEFSPGQVIQVAILKQAIAERQRVFDFLRGDEAYKSHWAVEEYRCHDIRVVPRRHTAQLRHQMWVAGGAMKQLIRTSLGALG